MLSYTIRNYIQINVRKSILSDDKFNNGESKDLQQEMIQTNDLRIKVSKH